MKSVLNRKKGASHVEIVISFILFVSFVLFAIYFFKPVNSDRVVDTTLDYTYREVIKNASSSLEIHNVKLNRATPEGAQNNYWVIDLDYVEDFKVVAFDPSGNRVNAEYGSGKITLETSSADFVELRLNEDLEEMGPGGGNSGTNSYELGSHISKNILTEKKLLLLNQTYFENYDSLKEQFNLPRRANFGFEFSGGDLEISARKEIPENFEVFRSLKKAEVLTEDGEIILGDLIILIW